MSYDETSANRIRVYKHKARYDHATVHSVIEDSHVVHVAFIRPDSGQLENQPMVGTMGYMLEQPVLYVHGNAASMVAKGTRGDQALPVCVTATHVDGVVFAYTPNGHALRRIFDQMLPGRWDHTAPLDEKAVRGVSVFRITIDSASAKVSRGMSDPGPAVDGVFAGIVPLYRQYGEPRHAEGQEVPQHIAQLAQTRSAAWRELAETQAREGWLRADSDPPT